MHAENQNNYPFPKSTTSKKLNIALLIGDLYSSFENTIFYGVKQFVNEHDMNLISFVGSHLYSPIGPNCLRNDIYDMVSIYNVDAILGISVTLGNYISKKGLEDFYKRFYPIPIVSIGMEVDDLPYICSDNTTSMRELIIHLIEKHACKNFAFIKGFEENKDSQLRFKVFKEVLAEYNLPLSDNLVFTGMFDEISGKEAAHLILTQNRDQCDAIVAANDYMAMGVINELISRGVSVPDQIKVVGFDDIPENCFFKVPLTTIRQPIGNLGYYAAELIYAKLCNRRHARNVILPNQLVIRKSCGCNISHEILLQQKHTAINNSDKLKKQLIQEISSLLSDKLNVDTSSENGMLKINNIAELLFESITERNNTKCYSGMKEIAKNAIKKNVDIATWCFALTHIFDNLLSLLKNDKDLPFTKELFSSMADLIRYFVMRQQEKVNSNYHEISRHITIISKWFANTFELESLKNLLLNELPWFGIRSIYISIFEREQKVSSRNFARLLIAYEDYKDLGVEKQHIQFISKEIIPGGFKTQGSNVYMIIPYHFENDHIGYIVYEINDIKNDILEILTVQIRNFLKLIDMHNKLGKDQISHEEDKSLKYKKSGLSLEKSQKYFKMLIGLMEKKNEYLNPDLTPAMLSEKINISSHNLSYIINEYAGMNFYDFVNDYRIKEIVKYLKASDIKKAKIIDIAMDFGFKSKSTFNKIFKKHTKMTPTEFKHRMSEQSVNKDAELMKILRGHNLDK
jgi:DNA-binding LacI/PurR family transcriptional regulator/AraC-like DNA-binding protein